MAEPMPSRPIPKDQETAVRLGTVRQRGTHAELLVRRAVRCCGQHYRLSGSGLPGRPDIVNKSRRWAIFVHGCFWHHHEGCSRATIPKHNREFWLAKFNANRYRDARALAELEAKGVRPLVIWECQTRDPVTLRAVVGSFFASLPDAIEARFDT